MKDIRSIMHMNLMKKAVRAWILGCMTSRKQIRVKNLVGARTLIKFKLESKI